MTDQPSAQDTDEEAAEPQPSPDPEPTAGPHPLDVTVERTGNPDVDALLERLADADDLPTEGHIEVYEDVHRGLRDTLTALDSRPGPPGPTQRHDDRS